MKVKLWSSITNGTASVRAHKVDLRLGNCTHSDLVESSREEGRKGAAEHDVPVATGQADAYAADVLLSDEALHVALGEGFLVCEGEGGVLGVSIESNNAFKVLAEFDQSVAIHLTSGMLAKRNFVNTQLQGTTCGFVDSIHSDWH